MLLAVQLGPPKGRRSARGRTPAWPLPQSHRLRRSSREPLRPQRAFSLGSFPFFSLESRTVRGVADETRRASRRPQSPFRSHPPQCEAGRVGGTSCPLAALLRQRARRLGDAGREKSQPRTLTVGSAGGEPRSATRLCASDKFPASTFPPLKWGQHTALRAGGGGEDEKDRRPGSLFPHSFPSASGRPGARVSEV